MMGAMQIAAVQLDIRWEDRAANHSRVRKLVQDAKLAPDTLVALPELFDLGFSMNAAAADPGEPSKSEAFCRALAAEQRVAVLAGVVARAEGGRLANEAVAYAPDGALLARYRKIQPFSGAGEETCYPAGTCRTEFAWAGARIAPFICYDLRFPELFRPAARAGAEVIVVVANWPDKRSEHWVRLLQARAIENQAWVLGVNRTGSDPTLTYDGRSCLFDPHGREVFQAGRDEQVLTADIDPAVARQWRQDFPALRDMRM
jgi:predicted amidohydrolase